MCILRLIISYRVGSNSAFSNKNLPLIWTFLKAIFCLSNEFKRSKTFSVCSCWRQRHWSGKDVATTIFITSRSSAGNVILDVVLRLRRFSFSYSAVHAVKLVHEVLSPVGYQTFRDILVLCPPIGQPPFFQDKEWLRVGRNSETGPFHWSGLGRHDFWLRESLNEAACCHNIYTFTAHPKSWLYCFKCPIQPYK